MVCDSVLTLGYVVVASESTSEERVKGFGHRSAPTSKSVMCLLPKSLRGRDHDYSMCAAV